MKPIDLRNKMTHAGITLMNLRSRLAGEAAYTTMAFISKPELTTEDVGGYPLETVKLPTLRSHMIGPSKYNFDDCKQYLITEKGIDPEIRINLNELNLWDMEVLGFGRWDEDDDDMLRMVPVWVYPFIAPGTKIRTINDEDKVVAEDYWVSPKLDLPDDVRNPFFHGVRVSQEDTPPANVPCTEDGDDICPEVVAMIPDEELRNPTEAEQEEIERYKAACENYLDDDARFGLLPFGVPESWLKEV